MTPCTPDREGTIASVIPVSGAVPHGTFGGYTNHGCRCVLCRAAKRKAARAYRSRGPVERAERCEECGGSIEQAAVGVPRRFCSERCAVRHRRKSCPGCGRRISRMAEWCGRCAQRAKHGERWALIEQLWAEGLSLREMGERLGIRQHNLGSALTHWRRMGLNLPYRYSSERREKIRQAALERVRASR